MESKRNYIHNVFYLLYKGGITALPLKGQVRAELYANKESLLDVIGKK